MPPVRRNTRWREHAATRRAASRSLDSAWRSLDVADLSRVMARQGEDRRRFQEHWGVRLNPLAPPITDPAVRAMLNIARRNSQINYVPVGAVIRSRTDGQEHYVHPSQVWTHYGIPARPSSRYSNLSDLERRLNVRASVTCVLLPDPTGLYVPPRPRSIVEHWLQWVGPESGHQVLQHLRSLPLSETTALDIRQLQTYLLADPGVAALDAQAVELTPPPVPSAVRRIYAEAPPIPAVPIATFPDDILEAQTVWTKKARTPPKDGTKAYVRVVKAGCVGETDRLGDFSCSYGWGCDDCPVTREKRERDKEVAGSRLHRILRRLPRG